jgi:hypothetical protein
MSPALCARLLLWRSVLPILKFAIPLHALTRLMWVPPSRFAPGAGTAEASRRLQTIEHVWRTGGRLLVSSNCLERSLVLYRILAAEGINPSLVLGVSRGGGQEVSGHAWIELAESQTFHDGESHFYTRFAAFGVDGRERQFPAS